MTFNLNKDILLRMQAGNDVSAMRKQAEKNQHALCFVIGLVPIYPIWIFPVFRIRGEMSKKGRLFQKAKQLQPFTAPEDFFHDFYNILHLTLSVDRPGNGQAHKFARTRPFFLFRFLHCACQT